MSMRLLVCAIVALGLVGCGEKTQTAEERNAQIEELAKATVGDKAKAPVGAQPYEDALKALGEQAATSWVKEGPNNTLVVGVVKPAYENDQLPVMAGVVTAQEAKGTPLTIYIVDDTIAKQTWKDGDEGLIESFKLPLEIKMKPIGGARPPAAESQP